MRRMRPIASALIAALTLMGSHHLLWGKADRLDIHGDYLFYSFDHNYIFGQGQLQLRSGDWNIQGEEIEIDIQSRTAWVTGPCQITADSSDFSRTADLVALNLEDASLNLFRFSEQIESERIEPGRETGPATDSSTEITAAAGSAASVALPSPPPWEKLRKSLLYFLCSRIVITRDYRVYGFGATVFVEGIQSLSFKKFKMDKGIPASDERPFAINHIWLSSSQGLVVKSRLNLSRETGSRAFKSQTAVNLRYDFFHLDLGESRFRMDMNSLHELDLGNRDKFSLNANLITRNMFSTLLNFSHQWGEGSASVLSLDFRKPYANRQELWLRLNSELNLKKAGLMQIHLGIEKERQYTSELVYQNLSLRNLNLTLQQANSRLLLGPDTFNRLSDSQFSLEYTTKLFSLAGEYSLNRDRLNDQTQASPQLRLNASPFKIYGGLLGVNVYTTFLINTMERTGFKESIYRANIGINLESEKLDLGRDADLQVAIASEQYLEKDPFNNTSAFGFIVRGRQGLFTSADLELVYNCHSQRRSRRWLISGTTSQDVSAIVRLREGVGRIQGWLSLSYDAKMNQFTTGYADAAVELFKNWQLQSQVYYDFIFKKFYYDFYLFRRAGRILLRASYRSLSRQFLFEILPG